MSRTIPLVLPGAPPLIEDKSNTILLTKTHVSSTKNSIERNQSRKVKNLHVILGCFSCFLNHNLIFHLCHCVLLGKIDPFYCFYQTIPLRLLFNIISIYNYVYSSVLVFNYLLHHSQERHRLSPRDSENRESHCCTSSIKLL